MGCLGVIIALACFTSAWAGWNDSKGAGNRYGQWYRGKPYHQHRYGGKGGSMHDGNSMNDSMAMLAELLGKNSKSRKSRRDKSSSRSRSSSAHDKRGKRRARSAGRELRELRRYKEEAEQTKKQQWRKRSKLKRNYFENENSRTSRHGSRRGLLAISQPQRNHQVCLLRAVGRKMVNAV